MRAQHEAATSESHQARALLTTLGAAAPHAGPAHAARMQWTMDMHAEGTFCRGAYSAPLATASVLVLMACVGCFAAGTERDELTARLHEEQRQAHGAAQRAREEAERRTEEGEAARRAAVDTALAGARVLGEEERRAVEEHHVAATRQAEQQAVDALLCRCHSSLPWPAGAVAIQAPSGGTRSG